MKTRKQDPIVDSHLCQEPQHDDTARPQVFPERQALEDALRDCLSPDGVSDLRSAIGAFLDGKPDSWHTAKELTWLKNVLRGMLE